jgi:hypothetical protein
LSETLVLACGEYQYKLKKQIVAFATRLNSLEAGIVFHDRNFVNIRYRNYEENNTESCNV